jgi:hypothetical protein
MRCYFRPVFRQSIAYVMRLSNTQADAAAEQVISAGSAAASAIIPAASSTLVDEGALFVRFSTFSESLSSFDSCLLSKT